MAAKDIHCNACQTHMLSSSGYAPMNDLAWHILVDLTASINMILVNSRMLVQ